MLHHQPGCWGQCLLFHQITILAMHALIHVQPEPITGSSRMKSGSVTKIILETLFILSMNKIMEAESSQW